MLRLTLLEETGLLLQLDYSGPVCTAAELDHVAAQIAAFCRQYYDFAAVELADTMVYEAVDADTAVLDGSRAAYFLRCTPHDALQGVVEIPLVMGERELRFNP